MIFCNRDFSAILISSSGFAPSDVAVEEEASPAALSFSSAAGSVASFFMSRLLTYNYRKIHDDYELTEIPNVYRCKNIKIKVLEF